MAINAQYAQQPVSSTQIDIAAAVVLLGLAFGVITRLLG